MVKLPRRKFLHLGAAAATLGAMSRLARADDYPTRPVRLFGLRCRASGGFLPDIIGRLIAQALSEKLGQPFVVENKPGASTNIGTELDSNRRRTATRSAMAMSSNAINRWRSITI